MKRHSRWMKWGVVVGALIVSFLLLEIATRSYDVLRGRGFFSNTRDLYGNGFKPYTMFGFDMYSEEDGKKYVLSRHGEAYPLEKSDGTYRIVAFGGSTTENQVAYGESGIHYPKLLEEKLRAATNRQNIEVINLGKSAYTTLHALMLLELNVASWDADLIIVSHNVNDLLTSYWPDFKVDYSHKYSTDFYLPDFKRKFATHNRILAHSQFYCAMRPRLDQLLQPKSFTINRSSLGHQPSTEAQEVFARNLNSIVAIARQHRIDIVLGTQPLEPTEAMFVEHMAHKKYNPVVTYPRHEEFVNHHETMNQIIRRVSHEQECHLVDVSGELSGESEYFVDFVHYTTKGVERVAESYADYLIENVFKAKPGSRVQ